MAVRYIEQEVCRGHWAELCQASETDKAKEQRLLEKIGLIRDEREVIPLSVWKRRVKTRDAKASAQTNDGDDQTDRETVENQDTSV